MTYPKDKEKEISIRIPLPTSKEVTWWIEDKRRFSEYIIIDEKYKKYNRILPVDYTAYKTMEEYIETAIHIWLKSLFESWINLKGNIIKL